MINSQNKLKGLLVALCSVGTLLIVTWLLRYAHYGIDFTDESFYLVWIANPFLFNGSITQFGFVYHPLYDLLGGDIAGLRHSNILITFGLAWSLTYFYLVSLAPGLKVNPITLLAASAGFATSSFICFDSWLPTPSYNSLALQSLLVSSIGLVLAEKALHRASIIGWLLIGIGGWLAIMAKPSTALALAVGVFVYLLLARKFSIRMLALTVVCALALLFVSALIIDGSVVGFINRYKLGIEFAGLLGAGHSLSQILRIDEFQLSEQFKLIICLLAGVLILALCSVCTKSKKWSFIGLLVSIALFTLTALLTLGQIHRVAELGKFRGLLIFAVVYAVAITTLVLGRLQALKTISLPQWSIAALFLVMPHIYAFGTNGNYWQAGGSAAIFWLLAGLALLGPLIRVRASWFLALPLVLAAQAVTATLLQTGLEQPYRQPQPLRHNVSTLQIGPQRSALTLSEGYSTYIASAMDIAKKARFESNLPLIDLSGQSPGILFAINAQSIGQAWTVGGYPGSLKLAEYALALTSCEKIAVAWVLFEPKGPRSIPVELMTLLGSNFPRGYELAGAWETAEGAGGYQNRRTQELYKPIEPYKTLTTCRNLREGGGKQ
jgi:hypothetical protein